MNVVLDYYCYCLCLVSDLRMALISLNMYSVMSVFIYSGTEGVNTSCVKRNIYLYSFLCRTSLFSKTDTGKWRQISVAIIGPLTKIQQCINNILSVDWFSAVRSSTIHCNSLRTCYFM
jgi:hypothetical protein